MMQAREAMGKHTTIGVGGQEQLPQIEPLFNDAFIRIFGSKRSYNLTKSLVNSILTDAGLEPVNKIIHIDSEHTLVTGSVECKTPRLDIQILSAGRIIDLEAQRQSDAIGDRAMLYASQLLSEYSEKGTAYGDLPQVVVITLLDNVVALPDRKEFITTGKMFWEPGDRIASSKIMFILVELEKFRKQYDSLDKNVMSDETLAWFYLLTRGFKSMEETNEIIKNFPSIEEFAELYGYALNDPKIKRAYNDMISAEREYNSRQIFYKRLEEEGFDKGVEHGMEKGIEQGIEQGVERTIAKLRELGADESLIEALREKE